MKFTFLLQAATSTTSSAPRLSFIDLIGLGGFVMIPLGILFVASIYIFIERLIYISSVRGNSSNVLEQTLQSLKSGDLKSALDISAASPSALGRILNHGISSIGNSLSDIERSLESATGLELSRMERNLGYLGIIAGIAPMLGFIGTIAGIIQIFYDIGLQDNISIGGIARGLYQKMVASGTGLIVGALAYFFYHLLNIRIDNTTLKIQQSLLQFMTSIQKKF